MVGARSPFSNANPYSQRPHWWSSSRLPPEIGAEMLQTFAKSRAATCIGSSRAAWASRCWRHTGSRVHLSGRDKETKIRA
eukprot:gene12689-biopygen9511